MSPLLLFTVLQTLSLSQGKIVLMDDWVERKVLVQTAWAPLWSVILSIFLVLSNIVKQSGYSVIKLEQRSCKLLKL